MEKYFVKYRGEEVGPLDVSQLGLYGIDQDSLVRSENGSQWRPAFTYPEIMSKLQSSKPASQPSQPGQTGQPAGGQRIVTENSHQCEMKSSTNATTSIHSSSSRPSSYPSSPNLSFSDVFSKDVFIFDLFIFGLSIAGWGILQLILGMSSELGNDWIISLILGLVLWFATRNHVKRYWHYNVSVIQYIALVAGSLFMFVMIETGLSLTDEMSLRHFVKGSLILILIGLAIIFGTNYWILKKNLD